MSNENICLITHFILKNVHVVTSGWKIDESMMNTFRQCWPTMEKLHTIKSV